MEVSCFRQGRQAATDDRWVDFHTGEEVAVGASGDESDHVLGGGGSLRGGTWG